MALNRAKVLETADKLVRQGKLDDAIKHYLVLSEDNPRDVNTINRIGDLYVRLRKNKEAIRQFMRIADFYAGDGFHLKAIAMYKKITKLEPTHLEANERLADMYGKQGLVTEARSQYAALAEQCLKAGQKDKALGIYEKILVLEPGNVKVRLHVAEIHAREGDPARAVEGLLTVVAELRKRNMSEEALKVLQKASRLQPSQPEVLSQMAELLQAAGKNSQEVLGVLESLHHGDPENQRNLHLLGEAYLGAERVNDFQKLVAAAAGERKIGLLEIEARFFATRNEPGKAVGRLKEGAEDCLRGGNSERAASLLEQAHQITPDDVNLLDRILEIWSQATHRDGMVSAIERLAQLHARREDWKQTGLYLDRLNDLAPESPVAGELRGKFAADLAGMSGGESSSAQEDSPVPTLDELEKVVDLEMASDDDSQFGEDLSFSDADPADEIELGDPSIDSLPNPLGIAAEDDVVIGEQEQAYSGKSVIQEMRGDPAKPDLDEDFLNEHLTEAEVFLKYGLVEKAREQLQAILDRYPDHLPSLMKMKEVHVEEGRRGKAARCSLRVAQLLREKGESEKAADWEEEARELDPTGGAGESETSEPPKPSPQAAAASTRQGSAGHSPAELSLDMEELSVGNGQSESSDLEGSLGLLADSPEEELTIDLVDETGTGESDESLISDRISQLEFSLEQGLQEEAEEIFRNLEVTAPTHPDLARLRARIKAPPPVSPAPPLPVAGGDLDMDVELAFGGAPQKGLPASPSPSAAGGGEDGFFDLAAELRAHAVDSTPGEPGEAPTGLTSGEEESIDEIFKAFRKKVDQQVEEEDYETRYNLGIAYKEMGLLDEAIGEFQYASRDPKLFMECCSILGICFREKGMSELAVKWYRKALASTGHPEEKTLGLRYDLAEIHLERSEHSQALSLFSEVYGINSNYRDVTSRIRELRKRVG